MVSPRRYRINRRHQSGGFELLAAARVAFSAAPMATGRWRRSDCAAACGCSSFQVVERAGSFARNDFTWLLHSSTSTSIRPASTPSSTTSATSRGSAFSPGTAQPMSVSANPRWTDVTSVCWLANSTRRPLFAAQLAALETWYPLPLVWANQDIAEDTLTIVPRCGQRGLGQRNAPWPGC